MAATLPVSRRSASLATITMARPRWPEHLAEPRCLQAAATLAFTASSVVKLLIALCDLGILPAKVVSTLTCLLSRAAGRR